jgi:hypothetical protein
MYFVFFSTWKWNTPLLQHEKETRTLVSVFPRVFFPFSFPSRSLRVRTKALTRSTLIHLQCPSPAAWGRNARPERCTSPVPGGWPLIFRVSVKGRPLSNLMRSTSGLCSLRITKQREWTREMPSPRACLCLKQCPARQGTCLPCVERE